jgi:ribosomal protein S18 acetylase RimI-like enzyme
MISSRTTESIGVKVIKAWKQGGLHSIVKSGIRNLVDALLINSKAIWFKCDLPVSGRIKSSDPEDKYWEVTDVDTVRAFAFEEGISWIDDEEDRCAEDNRHLMIILKDRQQIIGYIKAARNRCYIADFRRSFNLCSNTAFIYDTYIAKNHRGRNLSSLLIKAMIGELERTGIERVFCHIPEWNVASIRNYERCGFKVLYPIRFIRVLWIPYFSRPLPL